MISGSVLILKQKQAKIVYMTSFETAPLGPDHWRGCGIDWGSLPRRMRGRKAYLTPKMRLSSGNWLFWQCKNALVQRFRQGQAQNPSLLEEP